MGLKTGLCHQLLLSFAPTNGAVLLLRKVGEKKTPVDIPFSGYFALQGYHGVFWCSWTPECFALCSMGWGNRTNFVYCTYKQLLLGSSNTSCILCLRGLVPFRVYRMVHRRATNFMWNKIEKHECREKERENAFPVQRQSLLWDAREHKPKKTANK